MTNHLALNNVQPTVESLKQVLPLVQNIHTSNPSKQWNRAGILLFKTNINFL